MIDSWVEKGTPPDRVVATKVAAGGHARPSALRLSAARDLQGQPEASTRNRTSPALNKFRRSKGSVVQRLRTEANFWPLNL